MMLQTIDLYPDALRPKPVIFPMKTALFWAGLFFLLLILTIAGLKVQEYYLGATLYSLEEELKALQAEIDSFKADNQKQELDVMLQAKEEAYRGILKERERLLSHLEGDSFGYSGGFSSFFIALGKQHVQGLWLENIFFKENGREVTVRGSTLSSAFIPNYLTKLKQEDAFNGVSFTQFSLSQSENSENVLHFSLRVTEKDPDVSEKAASKQRVNQSAWMPVAP